MGDRAFLQGSQTEPEGQDLHRHKQKCPFDTDLDSPFSTGGIKVASLSFKSWLVLLKHGCDDKAQSLYLQESAGMAG